MRNRHQRLFSQTGITSGLQGWMERFRYFLKKIHIKKDDSLLYLRSNRYKDPFICDGKSIFFLYFELNSWAKESQVNIRWATLLRTSRKWKSKGYIFSFCWLLSTYLSLPVANEGCQQWNQWKKSYPQIAAPDSIFIFQKYEHVFGFTEMPAYL